MAAEHAGRERLIFHVDVNSAFLSWEATRRVKMGLPDLRLIPSCVGGNPEKRTGIVVAKSIPAKKYGIQTGEPMALALRKCPDLVCVHSDFELYTECSHAFKAICNSYAPVMESFSIDEVFLDMTGTGLIYPDPMKLACEIKDRIREELGFTVNIGISVNKLLAKMASDFEKPDKIHTLFPEEIPKKMWPLPVRELLFLGKASADRLTHAGIKTIGQLAAISQEEAVLLLGDKAGHMLWRYANGIDASPVKAEREEAKGISVETTLEDDLTSFDAALPILLEQTDVVAARMRRAGKKCTCIAVSYRTSEFKNHSHQCKLERATDVTDEIMERVRQLFMESWKGQPLRLIGVALTGLTTEVYEQFSFFEDPKDRERKMKLDQAVDDLRGRFGNSIITRGSLLNQNTSIGRKAKAQMENERKKKQ